MRLSPLCLATLPVLLALTSSTNAAAEGFALSKFDPAPAGDPFFGVQSPYVYKDLRPSFVLIGDYAHAPLVLRRRDGDEVGRIVEDQMLLHANASIAVAQRVLFHVNVPFAVLNSGESPTAGTQTFASPSGVALGDIRLGARLRLFGEFRDPIGVAIATSVWVPTGDRDAYVGEGRARVLPSLIAGGRIADVIWSTSLGFALRPERRVLDTPSQNEATFGGGVALLTADDKLQIGPEIYGTTAVGNGRSMFGRSTTSAELLLGVKYRPGPWVVGLAGGPGLGVALGTPDVRIVGMVGYAPFGEDEAKKETFTPRDQDNDAIVDDKDACPTVPGPASDDPKKNGCPSDKDDDGIVDSKDACPDVQGVTNPDPKKNGCPPDQDEDGILDNNDACPTLKGATSDDPKKNGCPPDKDDDGITDAEDACPDVKGVANVDPKKNGCPPDKDNDGIVDAEDACPDEPGVKQADPKKNGCPQVILTAKAIVITEQIHFEYNKATIMADSDALLQQIAKVLTDHPEIKKISIEGHTDNKGNGPFNMTLSQKRAEAVVQWLIAHGVDKSRLASKGFGMTKPIGDNKTEDGREKNRRVEFRIVDPAPPKDEKGAKP
jgi:OOP family OmpA-OmpF porin